MTEDISHRVLRVRLYEQGHTFEEIDNLSYADLADIVSYWSGKSKAEEKQSKARGQKPKGRKK